MREIIFRGQTRRHGEKIRMDGAPVKSNWVYGGIFAPNVDGDFAIIYGSGDTYSEPLTGITLDKYPVYRDTVGQYTGLKDKNGKRIFEGDIVDIIPMDAGIGIIKWDEDTTRFVIKLEEEDIIADFDNYWGRDLVVTGNIHDNPELLGGGA